MRPLAGPEMADAISHLRDDPAAPDAEQRLTEVLHELPELLLHFDDLAATDKVLYKTVGRPDLRPHRAGPPLVERHRARAPGAGRRGAGAGSPGRPIGGGGHPRGAGESTRPVRLAVKNFLL